MEMHTTATNRSNCVDDLRSNLIYLHIFPYRLQSIKICYNRHTYTDRDRDREKIFAHWFRGTPIRMTLMACFLFVLSLIDTSLLVIILHLIPSFGLYLFFYLCISNRFFMRLKQKLIYLFYIVIARSHWWKSPRVWLTFSQNEQVLKLTCRVQWPKRIFLPIKRDTAWISHIIIANNQLMFKWTSSSKPDSIRPHAKNVISFLWYA